MAKRTAMILLALALGAGTVLWAADATINISDESKQALKLVRMVRPQYPPEAKQAGIEGTVLLHVKVATDGTVKEIVVKEGEPKLVEATVEACPAMGIRAGQAGRQGHRGQHRRYCQLQALREEVVEHPRRPWPRCRGDPRGRPRG